MPALVLATTTCLPDTWSRARADAIAFPLLSTFELVGTRGAAEVLFAGDPRLHSGTERYVGSGEWKRTSSVFLLVRKNDQQVQADLCVAFSAEFILLLAAVVFLPMFGMVIWAMSGALPTFWRMIWFGAYCTLAIFGAACVVRWIVVAVRSIPELNRELARLTRVNAGEESKTDASRQQASRP